MLTTMSRCGFLAVNDLRGWKFKTYGIAATGRPRGQLLRAAVIRASAALPERPDREGAYGVGFLIVHDAPSDDPAGLCFALVDWWVRPDELYQRVFVAPPATPDQLEPLTTANIGNVAELAITVHERQAWIRHVLGRPGGPNIEGYLADVLRDPV